MQQMHGSSFGNCLYDESYDGTADCSKEPNWQGHAYSEYQSAAFTDTHEQASEEAHRAKVYGPLGHETA